MVRKIVISILAGLILAGCKTNDRQEAEPMRINRNVKTMTDFTPLSEAEQKLLESLAEAQKVSGPEHTGDFKKYENLTYHGISVAAILDTYNSAMVQPNPLFSGEMN